MSGEGPEPPKIAEPFLIDRVAMPQPFVTTEAETFTMTHMVVEVTPETLRTYDSVVIDRVELPVYVAPVKLELQTLPVEIEQHMFPIFPVNETRSVLGNGSELYIPPDTAVDLQNGFPVDPFNGTLSPPDMRNGSLPEEVFNTWLPNKTYTEPTQNFTTRAASQMVSPTLLVSTYSHNAMEATTRSGLTSQLCGFPSFCSANALTECANTALKECQQCSMAGASIFAALIVLLGLLIVLGNGFVIWCNLTKKNGFSGTYSKIKASLAVADMLTGFQIFGIAIYNFSWTLNSTAQELDKHQFELRGSPQSIVGGIFYFVGFTASLYHLIFLGQQRFRAIKWPIRYRSQRNRSVYGGLAVVWGMAVLMSVIPTFFSSIYTYTYSHTTFLFNLTLKDIRLHQDLGPLALLFTFLFIVPYVIMTALTVSSGAILRSYKKRSRDLTQRLEAHKVDQRETAVYKMLAVMQIGFTVTLVPLLVVVVLSYTEALTCETISTPLTICIYLSMSNSLVNVLVYGFMDKNFRTALREDVLCCFRKTPKAQKSLTPANQQPSKCSTNTTKLHGSLATHSV